MFMDEMLSSLEKEQIFTFKERVLIFGAVESRIENLKELRDSMINEEPRAFVNKKISEYEALKSKMLCKEEEKETAESCAEGWAKRMAKILDRQA
jgi:hypothetical protein